MKALLVLLGVSAIIAIGHTIWQKKKKKVEIPDEPMNDSFEGSDALPDSSDSDDAGEG